MAESNVALREKPRGSGEVVMMVVASAKTSRNKKVSLREDWLVLSVQKKSALCGKLMTSRMMWQEMDRLCGCEAADRQTV